MLLLAIIVRIKLGSSIIFCQNRVGKNEKIFTMYKFRTMTNEKDENGNLLADDVRLTSLGKFMRSTSIDELPELFNILIGNMSFVGPRPLLESYLPYYTKEERCRHDVRGGLIPPEMLYYDVTPTWDQQLEYEVNYVRNISFKLDVLIVFATFKGLALRNKNNYGSYVRQEIWEIRNRSENYN
jgi:undecaprenyl phosphate N,N'-diacetylbacillosamine 1-phosphate transferase